jgi:hypothetical protein
MPTGLPRPADFHSCTGLLVNEFTSGFTEADHRVSMTADRKGRRFVPTKSRETAPMIRYVLP